LAIFILVLSPSPGDGDVARMAQRYMEETSYASPQEFAIPRGTRGPNLPRAHWKHTTLNKIFEQWPDRAFQSRLRMSRSLSNHLVQGLTDAEVFRDNSCRNPRYRYTARYKILTSLYYLSHGGSYVVCADAAGVSPATLCQWVPRFSKGVVRTFAKQYLTRPSKDEMDLIWKEFEKRRGISNVGTAVNGTHVPWKPDDARYREDFHNYKGWHSILVVAFVNSFYMFSGMEIGWAGCHNPL
jgi:hypothetical protein